MTDLKSGHLYAYRKPRGTISFSSNRCVLAELNLQTAPQNNAFYFTAGSSCRHDDIWKAGYATVDLHKIIDSYALFPQTPAQKTKLIALA